MGEFATEDAMVDNNTIAQRSRLYVAAIERSTVDPAFRQRLIDTPRETLDGLAARLGLAAAPTGIEIDVIEVTPQRLQLLIPPLATLSLSDQQLSAVVAGAAATPSKLGTATLHPDAHGCPACPHPAIGTLTQR